MPNPAAEAGRLAINAIDVLPENALADQLEAGRPLRVKLGIDPTTPDIHLGHTVVLSKLREFQDGGHQVVLIIGDFTARVGDPSGRSTQRPVLSADQIAANAATYQEQAFKVLDRDRTEVRFNSEWLEMEAGELLALLSHGTMARLMERDIFQRRIEGQEAISVLELIYPLLQGYDSVAVDADVELGGTDQKFNLLFARDVQSAYGKSPQSIVTMPLLVGIDGSQKMSKSLDNYVGVTDSPQEMFGRLMRIPDDLMADYYALLLSADVPEGEPNAAKRELGRRIVERYHGGPAAQAAEEHFDRLHVHHELPVEIEEATVAANGPVHLPALLSEQFGLSRSEARRLIEQGGVRIDGEVVGGEQLDLPLDGLDGAVVQVGKRRHKRLRLQR
ncbi:MAG: tyrosine--tRNA ligase [Solirubrobacterales bacterium]